MDFRKQILKKIKSEQMTINRFGRLMAAKGLCTKGMVYKYLTYRNGISADKLEYILKYLEKLK